MRIHQSELYSGKGVEEWLLFLKKEPREFELSFLIDGTVEIYSGRHQTIGLELTATISFQGHEYSIQTRSLKGKSLKSYVVNKTPLKGHVLKDGIPFAELCIENPTTHESPFLTMSLAEKGEVFVFKSMPALVTSPLLICHIKDVESVLGDYAALRGPIRDKLDRDHKPHEFLGSARLLNGSNLTAEQAKELLAILSVPIQFILKDYYMD